VSGAPEAVVAEAAPRRERSQTHHVAGWRQHHAWSAGTSLRRLAARPLGSLLTIAVMGLALALPLAFYLLLGNVQRFGDALGQSQTINVFMQSGQDQTQATRLATQLRERAEVQQVTLKTPQQGLDDLARMQGFSGAVHALDDNPLPYLLEVLPKPQLNVDEVAALVGDIRALAGVDQVQDGGTWRQRLDALLGVGNRLVLVLAALLALAALLVVGNTVRVDISGRAEEIGVLTLIGAGPAFVRRPYLYAGIWYGLFSGVLAAALAVAIELALAEPVAALIHVYDGRLQLGGLPLWLLAATPLAAAALGWLGARLVSAWQLRLAS
jgi:cell division transport system permease protein